MFSSCLDRYKMVGFLARATVHATFSSIDSECKTILEAFLNNFYAGVFILIQLDEYSMMISSIHPLRNTSSNTVKSTQYIIAELITLAQKTRPRTRGQKTRPRVHTLAAAAPGYVVPYLPKYTRKRLWPAILVRPPAAISTIPHFRLRNMMCQVLSRYYLLSAYLDVMLTQP